MKTKHAIRLGLGLSIFALGLSIGSIQADNFHYEIHLTTRLLANAEGRLAALDMNWEYDPQVSAILLEGEDLSPDKAAATLYSKARLIMEDLHVLGYFTQLSLDELPQRIKRVEDYEAKLNEQGGIALRFRLDLETPLAVKGHKLAITLADYDGAALIAYRGSRDITVDAVLQQQCTMPLISEAVVNLPNGHTPTVQTVHLDCT